MDVIGAAEPAFSAPIARFIRALRPTGAPRVRIRDREPGRRLGRFRLTFYWMATERRDRRQITLYRRSCRPIARVSRRFASRLVMEGTGALLDGRTVNVAGRCRCGFSPCFSVLGAGERWGVGVGDRPLTPYRSVAVDPRVVPIGTHLYIRELDGVHIPGRPPWGGFVHDGCVVADDRGGGVRGHQLDLYALGRGAWLTLMRRYHLSRVTVDAGGARCAGEHARAAAPPRAVAPASATQPVRSRRSPSMRSSGQYSSTRFLPVFFARYSARSDSSISSSALAAPLSGKAAIPNEALVAITWSSRLIRHSAISARIRSAWLYASSIPVRGSTIANSSPP